MNPSRNDQADAQDWFDNPQSRLVSSRHDYRETTATAELSAAFLLSRYQTLNGSLPRSLLDIGCGEGLLLSHIAKNDPGISLTGTDTATEAIAHARQILPLARLLHHEGAPRGPFDAILIHLTLGLWTRTSDLLAHAVQQLSPRGLMYIVDINVDDLELGLSHSISDEERMYLRSQYASAYTLQQFTDLLTQAAPAEQGYMTSTGTATFAGFSFGSSEQLQMMTATRVVKALKKQQRSASSRLPALLHGWIFAHHERTSN